MYVLRLNDMRFSNIETLQSVARAETADALRAFIQRETVEPYKDGQWGKSYRKGGPLEWYNPPFDFDGLRHFVDVRDREACAANAARKALEFWDSEIEPLPTVEALQQGESPCPPHA